MNTPCSQARQLGQQSGVDPIHGMSAELTK